ncbi:MAG: hypothetical protein PHV32_03310 [Eubacteriales bacterium]|nr:hypothetical protein [Eubacteriales bacterium]
MLKPIAMRNGINSSKFEYIEKPNLPDAPVKVVLVDGRISAGVENSLDELGIIAVKTEKHLKLQNPVAYHPDMQFCHLGGKDIIYAPDSPTRPIEKLKKLGFNLINGSTSLDAQYPKDIAYNVAIVGEYAFHDFRFTDPTLKIILEKKGFKQVNVKQGYSKCSTAVLGSDKLMTADIGIFEAAKCVGIDALLIKPDTSIILEGYEHGFIGGCTGLIDAGTLAITGDISLLSQYNVVQEYLTRLNIKVKNLGTGKPYDTGSIIPLAAEPK